MRLRLPPFACAGVFAAALALPAFAAPPTNTAPTIKEIEDAGALLQKGDVDGALKQLEAAEKKNPKLPPAKLMLARLFLSSNQPQNGRGILEQVATEKPDHPEVYATLGSVALQDGRLAEAVLDFEKALEFSKAERFDAEQRRNYAKEIRGGLATACENRKDWPAARTHLAAWTELEPKNGQARLRLGRALFFLDKYDDAKAEFQRAVTDDPTLEPAGVSMGRLYALKGKNKEATELYESAVKAEPGNARVHRVYAEFLLQQDKPGEAKIHAEIALKKDERDRENQFMAGLVARYTEDYATAQKLFGELYNTNPADFASSNQLALILSEQSAPDARERGERMAEVNARQYPKNAEAASTLGFTYYRNRKYDEALRVLSTVAQSGAISPDTAFALAMVLIEKDKKEDAKKILQGAVEQPAMFFNRKKAAAKLAELKKEFPDAPKDEGKDKPKGR